MSIPHASGELYSVHNGPHAIPGRLNVLLLATAVGAASSLLWLASHVQPWYGVAAAALSFSFLNNTLFSLLHESVHSMFHPRGAVNEWCGRLAAGFFPTSLTMQRAFHLGHHQRNRTAVERFDYLQPGENRLLKYLQWYAILTGLYWLSVPVACLAYLLAPWVLRLPALRSQRSKLAQQTSADAMLSDLDHASARKIWLEILLSLAIQLAMFAVLDLNWRGWIACYAAFAVNWSSLQYADHAWSALDVRHGAWNLRVNTLVQYLFLHYHHHLAHHQHPDVPWIHLHRYVDFTAYRPRFLTIYLRMWRGPQPLPEPQAVVAQGGPAPSKTADQRRTVVGAGWQDLLAAPRARASDWRARLGLCAVFTVFFCVVYGATNWVTSLHGCRIPLHFAFEMQLPFVPALISVYSSLYLLMGLAPCVFRSWQALLPLTLTLMCDTLCAAVFFLVLPAEHAWRYELPSGLIGTLFSLADLANLEHNWFPSLHVAFAWTTALALRPQLPRGTRLLVLLWAGAIAVSTVLTRQHYLLDVAGGMVLAVAAMRLVYPRVALAGPGALSPATTAQQPPAGTPVVQHAGRRLSEEVS